MSGNGPPAPTSPIRAIASRPGAIGEYNGKFMANQMVLRGGCAATPRRPYAPDLSQLLSARCAMDVRRHSPRGGSPMNGSCLPLDRAETGRPRANSVDAVLTGLSRHTARHSGQVPLRRARLGAVRRDLRAAGILPDAHRDRRSCSRVRGRDRRAGRAGLCAGRVRQRLEREVAAADRRHARPRGLRADRYLAPASRRHGGRVAARLPAAEGRTGVRRLHGARRLPADVSTARRRHGFLPWLHHRQSRCPRKRRRSCVAPGGLLGEGGALVLGVDLKKDPQRLHDAYNDAAGVHRGSSR